MRRRNEVQKKILLALSSPDVNICSLVCASDHIKYWMPHRSDGSVGLLSTLMTNAFDLQPGSKCRVVPSLQMSSALHCGSRKPESTARGRNVCVCPKWMENKCAHLLSGKHLQREMKSAQRESSFHSAHRCSLFQHLAEGKACLA